MPWPSSCRCLWPQTFWPHISHTWRIRLTVAGSVWVLLLVIESWTVRGDVPNYVKVELLNQLRYAVEQAFWAKLVADRVTCDIQGLLVWDRHGVWAQCERTKEWIHDSYDGCMSHFSKCFSFESAHARVNSGIKLVLCLMQAVFWPVQLQRSNGTVRSYASWFILTYIYIITVHSNFRVWCTYPSIALDDTVGSCSQPAQRVPAQTNICDLLSSTWNGSIWTTGVTLATPINIHQHPSTSICSFTDCTDLYRILVFTTGPMGTLNRCIDSSRRQCSLRSSPR